jgi:hypothetical protein
MAGLHGIALAGALAPPRQVSELLHLQQLHSEKLLPYTAYVQRRQHNQQQGTHTKNGFFHHSLPPISAGKTMPPASEYLSDYLSSLQQGCPEAA